MRKPSHIDLFSGIGGFALACQWAGFETKLFCEIDPFCQKVLKKHWPDVPIVEDIKKLDGTKYTGATLLTGGFPCQPFSIAGKRRGKKDDRYLWPEMLRVISEARPSWIIGENVAGFINMGLKQCLLDLEGISYNCQAFVIPAGAINAQHKRERVWLVANSESSTMQLLDSGICDSQSQALRFLCRWGDESKLDRKCNGLSNRLDRNKAIGNAIVPQVAYEIIMAIKAIDENETETP